MDVLVACLGRPSIRRIMPPPALLSPKATIRTRLRRTSQSGLASSFIHTHSMLTVFKVHRPEG